MKKYIGILFFLAFFSTESGIAQPVDNEEIQQQGEQQIEVRLYPNPIVNELNIQCNKENFDKVEVWGLNRELLFVSPIGIPLGARLTINMSAYPQGYYAVKVYFSNKSLSVQTYRVYKN